MIGDKSQLADTLSELAEVHYWIGSLTEYEAARRRYEEALPIYREIGARLGEANAIRSLGDVHRMLVEYAQARELYDRAEAISREIGDRNGLAGTYWRRGMLYTRQGQAEKAVVAFQQAERIYTEIGVERWARDCRERIAALQQPA